MLLVPGATAAVNVSPDAGIACAASGIVYAAALNAAIAASVTLCACSVFYAVNCIYIEKLICKCLENAAIFRCPWCIEVCAMLRQSWPF